MTFFVAPAAEARFVALASEARLVALASEARLVAPSAVPAANRRGLGRLPVVAALLASLSGGPGCAAIYPEIKTPLREPPAGTSVDAPQNPYLVWIAIKGGEAPEKTRDGRAWHELGSGYPNPAATLFINDKELIRTNVETGTLQPTWPGSARGNFRISPADKVRVEMWEMGITKRPICLRDLGTVRDRWVEERELNVSCEAQGQINVAWEPAHGRLGYGFYYELRTYDVYVTRVFEESPAYAAGIRPGDQLIYLDNKRPREMKAADIQGYFNAQKVAGIRLTVRHADEKTANVTLKEGPVYPLFSEIGTIQ